MLPDHLSTANLLLRPFLQEDAQAVFDYWKSDPGWEKYNASVPPGFTVRDAGRFVEEMRSRNRVSQPNWAILSDDVVVGVVSLSFDRHQQSAQLGYGIHGGLRGRGLIVEVVTAVVGVAFSNCPELQTIQAKTDAGNRASIRVLQKLGFICSAEDPKGCEFELTRTGWTGEEKK